LQKLRAQSSRPRKVLMLGASGGVGRATLALLEGHPLGRSLLPPGSELLLLDRNLDPELAPIPACARALPNLQIADRDDFVRVLREHQVDLVVELATVGTWDCMTACAELGASYLTTSYEVWPTQAPTPCMLRARALFDPPDIDAGAHLLCMGMNPGLINLLVARGLEDLAARSGRPPSLAALDLHAVLFTELDATELDTEDPTRLVPESTFCSTWCPDGCLSEMLEPTAMLTAQGETVSLDHAPHRALYEARCGTQMILGHIVPHEELVSLAAMYPTIDLAFVYRMSNVAEAALAAMPERTADEWPTHRLYPPEHLDDLRGFSRIGALVCSRSLGELWIGWQTSMQRARQHRTNATLLQVATGVIAGWTELDRAAPGVYLPEELDTRRTLALAEQILGPLDVIWIPDAPARSIRSRRVA
jgi:homospermidine synthase